MPVTGYARRFAVLLLAVMCLACTHVSPAPDAWTAFAANERSVGFGNLWVGMSHSDAERVLARTIAIEDDSDSDACGSGHSTVEVESGGRYGLHPVGGRAAAGDRSDVREVARAGGQRLPARACTSVWRMGEPL